MRLCDERRLWFPVLNPHLCTPKRPRRQKKRQTKNEKQPTEKIQVELAENGERRVFVERPKLLRRSRQDNSLRVPDNSEDEDAASCQEISTQTSIHDLEFLLTDPQNRRNSVREISNGTNDKDKIVYKRGEVNRQTYRAQSATVNVCHETVNRITVNVSSTDGESNDGKQTTREDSVSSTQVPKEKVINKDDKKIVNATKRPRRIEKAPEARLAMVRVGGGWMELPDYLRYHKPMSAQEQKMINSEETNMIIRSQRPRTATSHSSRPSWTATLSRGTRGCGSTVLRQRLI